MEKIMTKNVQRWQSQKDNGGEPKINTDKDNSACQASNVNAVPPGEKWKLFCSSKRERPEDASLFKNSIMREKLVQTSEEKFLRQPSRRLKKYFKDIKISKYFPATNRRLLVSNAWKCPSWQT